jgi:hypothetical protein
MRKALMLLALAGLPLAASAQSLNLSPIASLLGAVASIIKALVPILVSLALVAFLWGLVKYLWGKEGKVQIDDAKKLMKWGLITLFVMVSVWGIIELMQAAFGINKNAAGRAPQIQYQGANTTNTNWSGSNAPFQY